VISTSLESKLRDDLERMKKIRLHRGLRHYWGLRVRGQVSFYYDRNITPILSAHQDNWTQGPHCGCQQEEGWLTLLHRLGGTLLLLKGLLR
jgi:hypothetical protein